MNIKEYADFLKRERFEQYKNDQQIRDLLNRIGWIVSGKKGDKPKLTNASFLFSDYEIFVGFFYLLSKGKYQVLEDVYDFHITDNIKTDFEKWLDADFNDTKKRIIYYEDFIL